MFTPKLRNTVALAVAIAALGPACTVEPSTAAVQPPPQHSIAEMTEPQTDAAQTAQETIVVDPRGPVTQPENQRADEVVVTQQGPAASPSESSDEPVALAREEAVEPGPRLEVDAVTDVTDMVLEASSAHDDLALDLYTYGHVAYLTVQFDSGVVAGGGDVRVDFGDGASESLFGRSTAADDDPLTLDFGDGLVDEITDDPSGSTTAPGPVEQWVLTHAYDLTLEPVTRQISVDLIGPGGLVVVGLDELVTTQDVYTLEFSPLTVTALNSCDTFGKGDFRVRWDQGPNDGNVAGKSWAEARFKLDAGESHTIDEFVYTRHYVTAERLWRDTLAMTIAELDPAGANLAVPWKWDGLEFNPSVPNGTQVIRNLADHSYEVEGSVRGVSGDDDCNVEWAYTATLDMYEG